MEINELCDTETKEPEIRNSERRPHVIEDAPSRKAPTSSEEKNNWKIIIGFELQSKFQRIIQLISIERNHASCNPSEQEKLN
jgi:hypothetical protein